MQALAKHRGRLQWSQLRSLSIEMLLELQEEPMSQRFQNYPMMSLASEILSFRSALQIGDARHDEPRRRSLRRAMPPMSPTKPVTSMSIVSGLSRHTRNLQDTGRVSLLFTEDEQSVRNIFSPANASPTPAQPRSYSRNDASWSRNSWTGLPNASVNSSIPCAPCPISSFSD